MKTPFETAWDLWFDLAQSTNASDQPYAHGVFVGIAQRHDAARPERREPSKRR